MQETKIYNVGKKSMPQSVEELYGQIGQAMCDTLPERWAVAWLDVCVDIKKQHVLIMPFYMEKSEVRKKNSFEFPVDLQHCFITMHSFFQCSNNDKAWNKCRFVLRPDGDFNLEFKFDCDLDYLQSISVEAEKAIGSDLTSSIKRWSGLKEDVHRPWLKNE